MTIQNHEKKDLLDILRRLRKQLDAHGFSSKKISHEINQVNKQPDNTTSVNKVYWKNLFSEIPDLNKIAHNKLTGRLAPEKVEIYFSAYDKKIAEKKPGGSRKKSR